MTPEQKQILQIVHAYGADCPKSHLVEKIGWQYYANGEKHVGDRISRMVKANMLIRAKPGLYRVGTGTKYKPATIDEGQSKLF